MTNPSAEPEQDQDQGRQHQRERGKNEEYRRIDREQGFQEIKAIVNEYSRYTEPWRDEPPAHDRPPAPIENPEPKRIKDQEETSKQSLQAKSVESIPLTVYPVGGMGMVLLLLSAYYSLSILYPLVGAGLVLLSGAAIVETRRGNRTR